MFDCCFQSGYVERKCNETRKTGSDRLGAHVAKVAPQSSPAVV
jgi:hypothetical protein